MGLEEGSLGCFSCLWGAKVKKDCTTAVPFELSVLALGGGRGGFCFWCEFVFEVVVLRLPVALSGVDGTQ